MFDTDYYVEATTLPNAQAEAVRDIPYEALLESFWPTIRALAAKYPSNYRDELRQAGRIALWQAQEDYQGDRGACFRTYAILRLQGAMKDALRLNNYGPRRAPVQRVALEAAFEVPAETGVESAWRMSQELPRALALIDPALRLFLLEEVFGGVTCDEVGAMLGISASRVSQRRSEAREALVKALN